MIRKTMVAMAVMAMFSPALYAQANGGPLADAQVQQPGQAKNYAQSLVERTVALHPELVELDLHMRPPGESESIIVAAKSAKRIGTKSDRDDLDVVKTGTPFVEINKRADQNVEVHLPLLDVTRKVIGELEMTFPYPPGSGLDKDALIRAGAVIRDELSRQIRYGNELFDPVLTNTGIPANPYAQTLVDDVIRKRRDVMAIAMHVARPGGGDYPIIASNIGRIGKPADADDRDVIETGKTHLAAGRDGDRLEVELPLQDAAGRTVGALAVVMPYRAGDEQATLVKRAETIRNELRARIPDAAALYEPKRLEPATSVVAAQLNDEALGNKESLPMTKEVMGAGALQTAQEGVTDAVKNQAGVTPTNSSGSPADAASIRGIKVNLFANYRLNGGLPTANVMSVPAENKQRVETLKGANALMFGVASPAGIINMVTKRAPMDKDVASIALLGNSFGQIGVAADVSHRFGSEKQFGLRVNASDTHLENGVHGASGRGWFGSVGADWQVTNRLHFQFDVETYRKEVVEQGSISLPTAVKGHITLPRVPDPRNLLSGPWAVFSAKTTNLQGRVDYDIAPGWKVLAEIGQSDSDRSRFTTRIGGYNVFTGAGGIATVNEVTQVYFNKYKRAELLGQFATGPLTHDITFGVSRSERIAETPAQNTVVLPVRVNIFDPIALPAPVPTRPDTSLPKQVNADTGLYTYDVIGIGAKWKFLLGFRESRSSANDGFVSSASWVGSPAFGILYDVLPTTTLFASYMKGLEDGGVGPANAKNAYQVLAPAVSTQYEFGVRDHYFRWLQVSASVFDIKRANAVTNSVTQIFANDGTIEYRGAEAVLTQDITREWSLSEAIEYLHAVQNPVNDMTIKGLTPENTPKWIGNIALTHRPSWLPGLSLTMRASFVTKRPVNPQDQGYIPGYTIYSLGASYATRIAGKHVDIRVAVDNLFNKRYWNSVQTGTLGTGMDRSVKMVAKIDF